MRIDGSLPLRPTALAVLAALAPGPLTGIEILDEAAHSGRSILGPGTLYRTLRELRAAGWIERVAPPADVGPGDERMQHHALTAAGRRILVAEAERLRETLARAGLLEGRG